MKKKLLDLYKKFSGREKVIFWITASVVGGVLLNLLVLEPVFSSMKRIDTNIKDEEAAARKSLKILLNKDKILSENKTYEAYYVAKLDPSEEITGLLKEIETIANRSGVNLVYVKPVGGGGDDTATKKYSASLECEGQMIQLVALFYGIENSKNLLNIEKYDIEPKSKESSVARCVMKVTKAQLG